ncbi:MAG: hypothetical protein FWD41_01545 [Actinomycetia bacterium]|nr:hypothetical protein [Actinomycetes bacterium]
MSRRSPLNKRYQKETTPKGVSKKSAASAKPARKQSSGRPSQSSKTAEKTRPRLAPDTDEYRSARKQWSIALAVAALSLCLSLVLTREQFKEYIPFDETTAFFIQSALTWGATGLIAYAWWLDFTQIRPRMKAHQAGITYEEYQERRQAKRAAKKHVDNEDAHDPSEETQE